MSANSRSTAASVVVAVSCAVMPGLLRSLAVPVAGSAHERASRAEPAGIVRDPCLATGLRGLPRRRLDLVRCGHDYTSIRWRYQRWPCPRFPGRHPGLENRKAPRLRGLSVASL